MAHPPLTVGALLLVAALADPAVAQMRPSSEHSYPIPTILSLPYQDVLPIWAEASIAVSANGEPNPAVFGSAAAGRIHEIMTTPADNAIYFNGKIVGYQSEPSAPGCRDVGTTYFDYPEPPHAGLSTTPSRAPTSRSSAASRPRRMASPPATPANCFRSSRSARTASHSRMPAITSSCRSDASPSAA
jgi:hypothetical protein